MVMEDGLEMGERGWTERGLTIILIICKDGLKLDGCKRNGKERMKVRTRDSVFGHTEPDKSFGTGFEKSKQTPWLHIWGIKRRNNL